MAEDPKIVLDPPPAEPVDVRVNPDPLPAEPFDVKVYPDPGPAGTFDVKVQPDPGPRSPVDVKTSPDGPPWAPHDVPLSPDGPPLEPFDVGTMADPAPRDPVDVTTLPDLPPAEPFDVTTNADAAPLAPFDVPTTPDGPPALPFDVATSPDSAPLAPFNVAVTSDAPPAAPFDVPIYLSPPPVLLEGNPGEIPTIDAIIGAIRAFDKPLASFLTGLTQINPISVSETGGGALDPTVLAAWFRDYTSSVGPGNVARFITQQASLYAMNPVVARVFDPTYFLKMMIPGAMGHAHTTIDTQAGLTYDKVALVQDEILKGKVNLNPERPGGNGLSERPDVYGPENTFRQGQDFSIDEMVDAAIGGTRHNFLSPSVDQTGLKPTLKFDAHKYFNDRDHNGAMTVKSLAKFRAATGNENLESREAALAASAFIGGVVRVPIGANEDPDGAVYSQTENPTDLVDDDDARIPLCFTDLRKDPVRNAYRSVYFRPLNLNFSNAISPEWTEGGSFGRVDPIVSYKSTTRTYNVSFEVHAFAPEDLQVMYNKMTWLSSMCYPSYGSDSLFKSGPVTRLRVGDAVKTELGGLTGVIKSLNFDFADCLWELKKGFKVPRSYKVSLDFLVLHEGPVGILNGTFGVFQLPPSKPQGEVDTTNQGGPTESREGPPRQATLLPGRFSKFGEPQR